MNSRLSSLTRRITAIKKEFSKREIESAIKLLEKEDLASPLVPYLSEGTSGKRKVKSRRTKKPLQDQRSKAVIRLEHRDRDKYRVLSELDYLLREGRVLPTVNEIRRLGESLTKDFAARNSRRDSISKLMDVLAARPLHEITNVVDAVLSNGKLDTSKSDYERLADFIITGTSHNRRRDSGSQPS
jgi:hypothetical protein